MKSKEQESSPTGQFALACEGLNEFARTLRETSAFATVRVGADIRYYESGWRLEKWVEAELDRDGGLWVAWWLEFGPHQSGWIIESHVAISPDVFYGGLKDRFAISVEDLTQQLTAAVEDLEHALQKNQEFADEVKKRMRTFKT